MKRILVVDDDPKLRKTLADILTTRGYLPAAVGSGKGLQHINLTKFMLAPHMEEP